MRHGLGAGSGLSDAWNARQSFSLRTFVCVLFSCAQYYGGSKSALSGTLGMVFVDIFVRVVFLRLQRCVERYRK